MSIWGTDQYIPNPDVAGSNPARDTNFSYKTSVFYIYFPINIDRVFKKSEVSGVRTIIPPLYPIGYPDLISYKKSGIS